MESLKRQSQKILRDLRQFLRIDDGLVTVEWVALTAAMVIAAVVISFTVMQNTNTAAKTVGGNIQTTVDTKYGADGSLLK